MKTCLAAAVTIAFLTTPAFAGDPSVNAQSAGGKPSTSINPSTESAAKNVHSYEGSGVADPSNGVGTGISGVEDPAAPQEQQDLQDTGEAPSVHNDPGTTSSPPPPDAK
jgi:type IV secretory pathway TrbL component